MTRPKGDADPWLTDMVSRDREIAKTVVYGIREIITLLRHIRDEQANEVLVLRRDNAQLRDDVRTLYQAVFPQQAPKRHLDYEPCGHRFCGLPSGHLGNHRPSPHMSG